MNIRTAGLWRGALITSTVAGLVLGFSPALVSEAAEGDDSSAMRVGVLTLAGAISAVGQTPELATALPYTTSSLADILRLDASLAEGIDDALSQGDTDLDQALGRIDGVTVVPTAAGNQIAFTYERTVTETLEMVYDDGDLRFGANPGAGQITVSLATRDGSPFVVAVDPSEQDPLLRTALVSQPVLDLSVSIDTAELDPFEARQGFTQVRVSDGHYRIDRDQSITMRDPDGRSLLTLEDLKFSTLPDLFRVVTVTDDLDIALDLQLPDSLTGAQAGEREGTMTLTGTPEGSVWPTASDATRRYGSALAETTGLSMADGLTSLAQYTGTALALQDAANVPFPNLQGGTVDLFAPGDRLLDLLSTAASAQISCGAAPSSPPTGISAPGETTYCQATTSGDIGALSNIEWSVHDAGTLTSTPDDAIGESPSGVVRIDGSDGEPDVQVSFTAAAQAPAAAQVLTARSMPLTVQDVVGRIDELDGSAATASIGDGRLDVAVDIVSAHATAGLELGNPDALGALVGMTGLGAGDLEARAATVATDSSFDVGFGIQTGALDEGETRETYLLPADESLIEVGDVSTTPPTTVTGLPARIGFLGVTADLTELELATVGDGPAVELDRVVAPGGEVTDPLPLTDLVNQDGTVDTGQLGLDSSIAASISFRATETAISAGNYAVGPVDSPAAGTASVGWDASGFPTVSFDDGYARLRVFDPVPAAFLSGIAAVSGPAGNQTVEVDITSLADGVTAYEELNVAPSAGPVEVARRLVGDGASCQNVTIVDADTLRCAELAPGGVAVWSEGQPVRAVVLGAPYAMRDSVIEGLASGLATFTQLDGDNVSGPGEPEADQYNSSLPMVDLLPSQLAVERDALSQGLAAIDQAAAADEKGGSSALPAVSSAQEMSAAVADLITLDGQGGYRPSFGLSLGAETLAVTLAATAPAATVLQAGLRLDDSGAAEQPGRGQVRSGINAAGTGQATLPVAVDSTTTLAIEIDRRTARTSLGAGTGTRSTALLDRTGAQLAGHPLQAGVAELSVLAVDPSAVATPSAARLGIQVDTAYDVAAGALQTTRSSVRGAAPAAEATLAVAESDVIGYSAQATDTSGGSGTAQPAPDPMQVKFLAEGLDGLAAAIESAQDGAAPRNLDPNTLAPVSAPLIGTDLDAGAGVPDILTRLTSALRVELAKAPVAQATDAATLSDAVEAAFLVAVNATDGLADVQASGIDVDVTCGGTNGACTPCPDGIAGPCTTETSTGWNTVTVSVGLTGLEKSGETEFQTGLAGLEVRSDKSVATITSWTLPVTVQLERGVGPQAIVEDADALTMDISAVMPEGGIDAIVGYVPAHLTAGPAAGRIDTVVSIEPGPGTYDLFQLYDADLSAEPRFADAPGPGEDGISLDFETLDAPGLLALAGNIDVAWTPTSGFGEVTYNNVTLDVGDVISQMATPFAVIDPYLAPVRSVVEVLRSPLPLISDLSELGGGGELSLLSLLETASKATKKPQLELAKRVIDLTAGATGMIHSLSSLDKGEVPLENLEGVGALLTIEPGDVTLYEKCTETVRTTTSSTGGATAPTTKKSAPTPCEAEDEETGGVAGQTTSENRTGTRNVKKRVDQRTTEVSGQLPGFSMPFLADADQIMDVLTGEGEASYFRLDLGTLAASVSYNARFGPIMAGPVPIVPFVGGSITLEGRLAMGFDSYPQTLAAQSVDPGDVDALVGLYSDFDGGDVFREGFYIDDLGSDGQDVPEVKLITTLEAGASVSIGIISAGLKGGLTLTLSLDLNDPNDDGRLRMSEISQMFDSDASCIFDGSGEIEAFIAVFVEIELLFTSLNYSFDILRLGPYGLFRYGCEDVTPTLVVASADGAGLTLTSGASSARRYPNAPDIADDYEVRQFGGGDRITYEIAGFGRVQNAVVEKTGEAEWTVTIYKSGVNIAGLQVLSTFSTSSRPTFRADGGSGDDKLSLLPGEAYDDAGDLQTTPFDARVASLTGGVGDDALKTGDGEDTVDGGDGDDNVETGLGSDVATGGPGDDVIDGGAGRDDLGGGTGNDRISGGPGADRVAGEDGDDAAVGGPGRDVNAVLVRPRGSAGSIVADQVAAGFDSGDVLIGGAGTDTVDGGDGSDVVVGGEATSLTAPEIGTLFGVGSRTVNVLVQGDTVADPNTFVTQDVTVDTAIVPGDGQLDALCGSGATAALGASTDYVTGGDERDIVIGGNGADRLDGGAGPDEICGRAGNDEITGDGSSTVQSADPAEDADIVRGGHDDDRVEAGPGNDIVYGDDVSLSQASGSRRLDGSSHGTGSGEGEDYLDGAAGDDILAGQGGSDLILGGEGDDATYGESLDTAAAAGEAPPLRERLLGCNLTTRVVLGSIDLNGDLLAGAGDAALGIDADSGQVSGLPVIDGLIRDPASGAPLDGLVAGSVVVVAGHVDLDRDGNASGDRDDTGMVELASMLDTGANTDGDCILAGAGDDDLRGGAGSDYLGAGEGVDLAGGGDGNDLILGDGGTDVLLGGADHDVVVGGTGDDHLVGGNGDDRLRGNEGADDLIGGSEAAGADDGQDVLVAGESEDVLVAENGTVVSDSIVAAVAAASPSWTDEALTPTSVGDDSGDLTFDDSALVCDGTAGARHLSLLAVDSVDGVAVQSPGTPPAYDELYGGGGCDFVFGSPGDDLVRGGPDDDLVEGGSGADLVYGDDGNDVLVGGSSYDASATRAPFVVDRDSTGQADGGDTVYGDAGPDGNDGEDLIAGDNALPVRVATMTGASVPYVLRLRDVATVASVPSGQASGPDHIDAGDGADKIFGQGDDDTVAAGDGTDYVEGNDGSDTIGGDGGNDDLIGGSSAADGLPLGADGTRLGDALPSPLDLSSAGVLDEGQDVVDGSEGDDLVLGDNGRITHPTGGAFEAVANIARADEATSVGVHGDDTLGGGSGYDRLLGQGGDDVVTAGPGEDHIEGNQGDDALAGGAESDTIIGGSSLSPDGRGTIDGLAGFARVQSDGGDTIDGDGDGDLLLGDNATVLVVDGLKVVQLADVASTQSTPAAGTSGNDTIVGADSVDPDAMMPAADRVFGQGGDDTITTGSADDYVEGNAGLDRIDAGPGDDDLIGGSSSADGRPFGATGDRLADDPDDLVHPGQFGRPDDMEDHIDAGAGDDVVLGDNGLLTRPADAPAVRADGSRLRTIRLDDVILAGSSVPGQLGGGDVLVAGEGEDLVFGQSGDDVLFGGVGEDYLEGNAGADTLSGADGEDDLVGGGSTSAGSVITSSAGSVEDRLLAPATGTLDTSAAGLVDDNDTLDGGDDTDVLVGDNGRITRDAPNLSLIGASGAHRVRHVTMADESAGVWSGSDRLSGGSGDDELYGQFDNTLTTRPQQQHEGQRVAGDVLDGGAGDDALIGDQGVDVPTPAGALGATGRTISDDTDFFREKVRLPATLVRVVTLTQSSLGGDDLLLAGPGDDSLHAGAGKDVLNAASGADVVFGGDGRDALWGGGGHDRLFGGTGSDTLDIKRRGTDPVLWRIAAPSEDSDQRRATRNGRDLLFGGSGADALQADMGDVGTARHAQGDRLVDWEASANLYKACRTGYGRGKIRKTSSASMTAALRQLAVATGSVGSGEVAIPVHESIDYTDPRTLVCEAR
ncbi:MAG: hypothetical protein ACSLEW_11765 [Nocardioides sp.]